MFIAVISAPVELKTLEGKIVSHVQCGRHYGFTKLQWHTLLWQDRVTNIDILPHANVIS